MISLKNICINWKKHVSIVLNLNRSCFMLKNIFNRIKVTGINNKVKKNN